MFLQYLANWLSGGWNKSCAHVLTWIKLQLAFACCCLSSQPLFPWMMFMYIGIVGAAVMMELASLMLV